MDGRYSVFLQSGAPRLVELQECSTDEFMQNADHNIIVDDEGTLLVSLVLMLDIMILLVWA